jgi:glycerol-3-phosphate acyltransferase PlsY
VLQFIDISISGEFIRMQFLWIPVILIISYLIGSIPFGLVIVKLRTGKDIRQVESGRTGGTNAMRAAGCLAGVLTTVLDAAKSTVCVWLAIWLLPANYWIHVLAPIMAILGHNYSIFLIERDEKRGIRLRGGAGGAPAVGGAIGLWIWSLFIIAPLEALIFYFIGYASVATMSGPVLAMIIFAVRAYLGLSPWQYVLYGVIAEFILIWALRPNIRRLIKGEERLVGFRAMRKKRKTGSPGENKEPVVSKH